MSTYVIVNIDTGRILIDGDMRETAPGNTCREVSTSILNAALRAAIHHNELFGSGKVDLPELEQAYDRCAVDFSRPLMAAIQAQEWLHRPAPPHPEKPR